MIFFDMCERGEKSMKQSFYRIVISFLIVVMLAGSIVYAESAEEYDKMGLSLSSNLKYNEAIETFEKAIEIDPDYYDAWKHLEHTYFILRQYDEALEASNKTISINSDDPVVWLSKGLILDNLGRYEESIEAYDKSLSINPEFVDALNEKGNALLNLGRYEEAINLFEKVLSLDSSYLSAKDNKEIALGFLKELKGEDIIDLSGEQQENETSPYITPTITPISTSVIISSTTEVVDADSAEDWYEKGNSSLNKHRYSEAAMSFEKTLEIDQNNIAAWHGLGEAYEKMSYPDKSVNAYDEILKIDQNDILALIKKGEYLLKKGKNDEAFTIFEKILELDPNNVDAWNNKGYVLLSMMKYDEAREAFNQTLIIDTENSAAKTGIYGIAADLISRAIYLPDDRSDEKLEMFKKALEFDPENIYAKNMVKAANNPSLVKDGWCCFDPTDQPTQIQTISPIQGNIDYESSISSLTDYTPSYAGGATIHITNQISMDCTIVWTTVGSKKPIIVVSIPNSQTQTVSVPAGTADMYVLAGGQWYKAGSISLISGGEYELTYYMTGSSGTGLTPIPASAAPVI